MKIPKKLKIGGFIWTVEENEKVSQEAKNLGSTHYRKQRIFIDPFVSSQKKEHGLIHESLHVIFWQSGLRERMKNIKEITEEEIIQTLSMGLYQVLKDNRLMKQ